MYLKYEKMYLIDFFKNSTFESLPCSCKEISTKYLHQKPTMKNIFIYNFLLIKSVQKRPKQN